MTTSSKISWRRACAGGAFAGLALLAGCDTPNFQAGLILQGYRDDPKATEEYYQSYVQYESNRRKALYAAFGADVIYVSPEQQDSFFVSLDAFLNSVMPGLLSNNVVQLEDPLVEYLRSLDPIVLAAVKDQNQQFVDERVEQIRRRAGDYGQYLGDEQIREIVWDDKKYQDFLTDRDYALSELAQGIADTYEDSGRGQEAMNELQDALLPVTMPTPQPPS